MAITIKRFIMGPIDTNGFVVFQDGPSCLVIDPSSGCDQVLSYIEENKLTVEAILLTHAHFDHVMGIDEILEKYPEASVWIHPAEKILLSTPAYNGSPMIGQEYTYTGSLNDLKEGELSFKEIVLKILEVPGHSPGGCAFVFEDYCISGDTLFAGSIGRTDFYMGDFAQLIENIKSKLMILPDETVVFSGHGNRTTIGREKRYNQFLR